MKQAFFYDPAGSRNRDGDNWQPVLLTEVTGTFNDGSQWLEVATSSGRGRTLAATDIRLSHPEGKAWELPSVLRGVTQ